MRPRPQNFLGGVTTDPLTSKTTARIVRIVDQLDLRMLGKDGFDYGIAMTATGETIVILPAADSDSLHAAACVNITYSSPAAIDGGYIDIKDVVLKQGAVIKYLDPSTGTKTLEAAQLFEVEARDHAPEMDDLPKSEIFGQMESVFANLRELSFTLADQTDAYNGLQFGMEINSPFATIDVADMLTNRVHPRSLLFLNPAIGADGIFAVVPQADPNTSLVYLIAEAQDAPQVLMIVNGEVHKEFRMTLVDKTVGVSAPMTIKRFDRDGIERGEFKTAPIGSFIADGYAKTVAANAVYREINSVDSRENEAVIAAKQAVVAAGYNYGKAKA